MIARHQQLRYGLDLEVADDRLIYDGDIKANPVVEASSVIVVPGTEVRVYVAGFVARPGQVALRRGATALDAIAAAGGVTSSGDGTRVALARKTNAEGVNEGALLHLAIQDCGFHAVSFYGARFGSMEGS